MKTFAISVKTTRGNWGSRCQRQAESLEAYLAMPDVQADMAYLTRFKDTWRVVELPLDLKTPAIVVFTPSH